MIAISGIIAGASAITLAQFNATTSDTTATLAIGNAADGVGTLAEQFPTIAIIGVMVIIISMLATVFVYVRYFR